MKNIAMTPEEAKEYSGMSPAAGDEPKYPYGLNICLNDSTMKKIGMDKLPEVGTTVLIQALAVVSSVRQSQQQDGDKESGVDLQITDLEVTPGEPKKAAADVLYPNMMKE